jgi:hypothetical protein
VPAAANPGRLRFISMYLPWFPRGSCGPFFGDPSLKPAAEPCYPRLIAECSFTMPMLRSFTYIVPKGVEMVDMWQ